MPVIHRHVRWAIALTLLVNAASMVTPIINEGDSVIYASLSKHMVESGNWSDLFLSGADWLDKPHFPFWMTALSFSLGGVSAFTYILPGFLFHLLGGYFTYRLARTLYDKPAALLALLVYVSVFHLMYTSSVIKAEAFLTGSITGAVYYWLRFDATGRAKHLLLGALLTAVSVMTKGIFTMITIASGLVCMWVMQRRWRNFVSLRWWFAAALSVVFLAPELLSLYLQFDAQPQKVVFGQTAVSGIRFFLWDSQFGRFFNSGPIRNDAGDPLYFVHVFLWAFLPWVAVYIAALYRGVRAWSASSGPRRDAFVLLSATFFVTFGLFSATSFQLDYYTVILFPFAAVLCGSYLSTWMKEAAPGNALAIAQWLSTLLVFSLAVALALYVGRPVPAALVAVFLLAGSTLAWHWRTRWRVAGALLLPVLAVNALYVFLDRMTYEAYAQYSVPHNVTPLLRAAPELPVYVYRMDYIVPLEINLYSARASFDVANPAQLPPAGKSYVLVVRDADWQALAPEAGPVKVLGSGDWVDHKTDILPRMLRLAKGVEPLDKMHVIQVGGI